MKWKWVVITQYDLFIEYKKTNLSVRQNFTDNETQVMNDAESLAATLCDCFDNVLGFINLLDVQPYLLL